MNIAVIGSHNACRKTPNVPKACCFINQGAQICRKKKNAAVSDLSADLQPCVRPP